MAKSCVNLQECKSSFNTGPLTEDGHKTFIVCSPCGRVGGCKSMSSEELIEREKIIGKQYGRRRSPKNQIFEQQEQQYEVPLVSSLSFSDRDHNLRNSY